MNDKTWQSVLEFWFDPENQSKQFLKDDEFDQEIRDKFYDVWEKGRQGLLSDWRKTLKGRLAEIIVLDQFSRNLCREKSCAFTQDDMALVLSQEAIKQEGFYDLSQRERQFLIMPFMHSESFGIQEQAIVLFEELGHAESTDFAYKHKAIIERFGHFPHRNNALGRKSTQEEIEFLKQPGSSF